MAVVNANTPLIDKTTNQDFYPLTAYNQIVMPDGTRWDGTDYGASISALQNDVIELKKGIKAVVLWENPNAFVAFPATTVNIPTLPDYPFIIIYYYISTGFTYACTYCYTKTPVGILTTSHAYNSYRAFRTEETSIAFENSAYYPAYNGTATIDSRFCIPVAIVGIK